MPRMLILLVFVLVVLSACSKATTRFIEIQDSGRLSTQVRFDQAKAEIELSGVATYRQSCNDETFSMYTFSTKLQEFNVYLIYNKKSDLVGIGFSELGVAKFSIQGEKLYLEVISHLRRKFDNVSEHTRTKDTSGFIDRLMANFNQSKCFKPA